MQLEANCLVQELSRFKQSSKEAVENTESFTQFKEYMHVERPFERKLKEILQEVQRQDQPQLVLVCGSVGDGKSHLISYLKNTEPDLFHNLKILNDATESFSPTKTSIDTLREELGHFSDEKLSTNTNQDHNHVIIAINLGTLNNFLHSTYGDEFTFLREFVEIHKILEDERRDEQKQVQSNSPFRFINLSDYHLYELAEGHTKSVLLEQLFHKITQNTPENPFYRTYEQKCKKDCSYQETCPVVKNYEMLNEKKVQEEIIHLLAELTIKFKQIVSPRMFLDFIYKMLVPEHYVGKQSKQEKLSQKQYVEGLLPNLVFQLADRYENYKYLKELEPNVDRDQHLDEFIIAFFITDNISNMIFKVLPEDEFIQLGLAEVLQQVGEKRENREDRMLVLKTLLRFQRFFASDKNSKENLFRTYLRYLYYWNKNDYSKLRDLYKDVQYCIYNWNGRAEQERINVFIGKNQLKYSVSQKLSIEHSIDRKEKIDEEVLNTFLTYMIVKFKEGNSATEHSISIDYNLFELLMRIKQGYRPNSQDKNNFINFVDFVEKLIKVDTKNNSIEIKEKTTKNPKEYVLTHDPYFGYDFKEK